MNYNKQHKKAIEQANINFADIQKRGKDALGSRWEDVRKELFTPEELAASELRLEDFEKQTKIP
jgi:hypothetical protein